MTGSADGAVLVTGAAGYIGSHVTDLLLARGRPVAALDDLSTGHRDAVSGRAEFFAGDIADAALLREIFTRFDIAAIMHFAAFSQVEESVLNPALYYQNNVAKTLPLLDAMRAANVRCFIYSSTAAVFGAAQYLPIDADHPKSPINPYGTSKYIVERILADYQRAYGLRYAALRYFNACGADPDARLGELHDPETHLIPLACQTASGRRDQFLIYGDDYDTEDGTCRRDYVHVCDLAAAHLLALDKIMQGQQSASYNLGNGSGYTVRQVVETVKKISGRDFPVSIAPRREGDPAALVADAGAAIKELGWQPQYSDLEVIVRHAWQWEQTRRFNPG